MNQSVLKDNLSFLQHICNYLVVVMGHTEWCQNPHTRSQLIMLFSVLSTANNKKEKDVFG